MCFYYHICGSHTSGLSQVSLTFSWFSTLCRNPSRKRSREKCVLHCARTQAYTGSCFLGPWLLVACKTYSQWVDPSLAKTNVFVGRDSSSRCPGSVECLRSSNCFSSTIRVTCFATADLWHSCNPNLVAVVTVWVTPSNEQRPIPSKVQQQQQQQQQY